MSGFSWQASDPLSFVALGDSFTEGLSDLGEDGAYRGWADRLAEALAARVDELHYANLAVRGKLARQIIGDQVPQAVELRPDLVALAAGGNDLIRPGADPDQLARVIARGVAELHDAGAHVVLCTGTDTNRQPVMRHLRGKIATYNMHLHSIAQKYGCTVVDLWHMTVLEDTRAWSDDRLHLSAEGHRRVALRAMEVLGLDPGEDWREPWPLADSVPWGEARKEDLRWAREFLIPWVGRRVRGISSGDGRLPKRPTPEPLR